MNLSFARATFLYTSSAMKTGNSLSFFSYLFNVENEIQRIRITDMKLKKKNEENTVTKVESLKYHSSHFFPLL